jgi:hypothetical protein
MTGFLVSAATGPMNSLLCKLVTLLGDEYKLLKGIRKEIRALRDELSSMNALLRKLSDAGDGELDVQRKEWRNKVRELVYDVEDCIDVFMHQLRRPGGGGGGSGSDANKAGLVRKLTAKIKKLRRARRIAVQIQELKSRVVEESGRRHRYKLDDVPVPGKNRRVEIDPRLPAMYSEAKSLVGIDGPRDKIVHRLTGQEQGEQLTVVSIVGFGGVGKTTLANQVYCKIKGSFECTAFVSVSQSPDLSRVLSDMLSQLGCSRVKNLNDLQQLVEKIRERLSNKRYACFGSVFLWLIDWCPTFFLLATVSFSATAYYPSALGVSLEYARFCIPLYLSMLVCNSCNAGLSRASLDQLL